MSYPIQVCLYGSFVYLLHAEHMGVVNRQTGQSYPRVRHLTNHDHKSVWQVYLYQYSLMTVYRKSVRKFVLQIAGMFELYSHEEIGSKYVFTIIGVKPVLFFT